MAAYFGMSRHSDSDTVAAFQRERLDTLSDNEVAQVLRDMSIDSYRVDIMKMYAQYSKDPLQFLRYFASDTYKVDVIEILCAIPHPILSDSDSNVVHARMLSVVGNLMSDSYKKDACKLIRRQSEDLYLSCAQVRSILTKFAFDSYKKDVLELFSSIILDKSEGKILLDCFMSISYRNDAIKILGLPIEPERERGAFFPGKAMICTQHQGDYTFTVLSNGTVTMYDTTYGGQLIYNHLSFHMSGAVPVAFSTSGKRWQLGAGTYILNTREDLFCQGVRIPDMNECAANKPKLMNELTEKDIEEEEPEGDGCIVCIERKSSTFLLPCGHAVMCKKCAWSVKQKNNKCPACNEDIVAISKMFLSV